MSCGSRAKGWRHEKGVETRLDGETLVLRIPMRFQRRGGRKRIVAPDGSEIVPTSKPQPDGTLVKALARAWRWQRMLDDGVYATFSDLGDADHITQSYVSRMLQFTLIAPDIIDRILAGRQGLRSIMLAQLERPLPANWEEQRRKTLPVSDDSSSPRPPSLSDRQHLIRSGNDHLNLR